MSFLTALFPELKPDPRVGDIWVYRQANPFDDDDRYRVVDVRQGWVKYEDVKPTRGHRFTHTMEIHMFKVTYDKVG